MKKKFMVDIESTGVEAASDEILQVAFLELNFDGKLYVPGRSLEFLQHSDRQPTSEFAKEHMAELYARCNVAPHIPIPEARQRILQFFRDCGAEPPKSVFLAGHNAPNFDIPFLVRDGYLEKNRYQTVNGKDVMVGDFHYRLFDLNSALDLAEDVTGLDRKTLIAKAKEIGTPKVEPKPHDALNDCYTQTQLWNGLLRILRGEK